MPGSLITSLIRTLQRNDIHMHNSLNDKFQEQATQESTPRKLGENIIHMNQIQIFRYTAYAGVTLF